MSAEETVEDIAEGARQEEAAYEGDADRPLGAMSAVIATYAALVAGLVVVAKRRDALPERLDAKDLALAAVATHKLSRLIAKDPVASPLRAPFTRFEGRQADAELHEEVRGTGLRKALGELVTCPFCIGQWAATGLVFGLVVAPRFTRVAASVFAVVTGADVLQYAYAALQERAEG